MERAGRDWRTVLLIIGSSGAALLAFVLGILILTYSASGLYFHYPVPGAPDLLQAMVLAGALWLIGSLSFLASYQAIRRFRSQEIIPSKPMPLGIWQGVLLVILWIGSSWLAQRILEDSTWKWLAPGMHLLAIGTPVYFGIRLASGGMLVGSPSRFWGLLATGMLLGTGLAFLAETALVLTGFFLAAIHLAFRPEALAFMQQLGGRLSTAENVESVLSILGPWLNHPVVFIVALVLFSGLAPVIEESVKTVGVWMLADRSQSPALGFTAGILSGAGFSLVEGLLASARVEPNWSLILIVRAGSTLMHIAAAGLTGWGISSFRVLRQWRYLFAGFALAFFVHGAWNASVVALQFGAIHLTVGGGRWDSWGAIMVAAGGSLLALLAISMPVALGLINWRMRHSLLSLAEAQTSPKLGLNTSRLDIHPGTKR